MGLVTNWPGVCVCVCFGNWLNMVPATVHNLLNSSCIPSPLLIGRLSLALNVTRGRWVAAMGRSGLDTPAHIKG